MWTRILGRAVRPAALRPGSGPAAPAGTGLTAAVRRMGTHGRKEPREPLNSPKRAKEFIYRLQPAERSCLLGELQGFESRARAQGEGGAKVKGQGQFRDRLESRKTGLIQNRFISL
uniref:Uncharacterized protein n=1 Tax=Sphaeramia orbicularis TaxID=375764 RepID=A0A673B3X1_9TELE